MSWFFSRSGQPTPFPNQPFFDVVHMFDFITKAKSHKSVLMMFSYFSLVLQVGGNIYVICVCLFTHTLCTNYISSLHICIYIYIYLFIYTIMSQSLDLSLVCHQCFNVFTIRSNGKVGASRQAHNAHNGHNSVVLLRSSCSHCCATLASQGDKLRSASLAVRQSPAIRHAKPSLTKHDKTQERHFSLFTWLIPKPSQWA